MGCDAPPSVDQKPQRSSGAIPVKDPSEAERIFRELSQDGSIQQTFWATRFGMLNDRYGIPGWLTAVKRPSVAIVKSNSKLIKGDNSDVYSYSS